MKRRPPVSGDEKLEAWAVTRVIDKESGLPVGWLYVWNTGDHGVMWFGDPSSDVRYEPIPGQAGDPGPEDVQT